MKVFVILPAAGLGTRMASHAAPGKKAAPSKQFTDLAGTPILVHTLRKFASVARVSEVWVALRQPEISGFQARLRQEYPDVMKKRVELIEGGEQRQQSVANGLKAIAAAHAEAGDEMADDDIILVHDAVRPLVSTEIIEDVLRAVEKHGAAIAGLPAIDTIKQVERKPEGAVIHTTIPRASVVMAQTPQGFRYGLLKKAFADAAADGFLGTDEASLLEHTGVPVAVVMGSPRNLKITAPADMELAEFYLKH